MQCSDNYKINVTTVKKHIVAMIVILVMILGSGDSLNIGDHDSIRYGLICLNFGITAFLCLKRKKCNIFMLKVFTVMCVTIFASMIANQDFHGYTTWVILAVALFTEESIEYDVFYKALENIIFLICIFSLLGMAIWFVAPDVIYAFPRIDSAIDKVHNLFVTVVPTAYEGFSFRNYGIFREPAMFCIYIGLALIRQVFYIEKMSVKRCAVFLLTVFTTKSMTGYIATLFLFVAFIVIKKKSWQKYCLLIMILLGAVVAERSWGLSDYFMDRLDVAGASAYSASSRLYSIVCGLMAGFTNPLFGCGAVKSNDVFRACVILVDVNGRGACWANMITYFFASFGIIFITIFLVGLFGMILPYQKSKLIAWVNLIYIALLLCGEIMTYSTIMFAFMMYGIKAFSCNSVITTLNNIGNAD